MKLTPKGKIIIEWTGKDLEAIKRALPDFANRHPTINWYDWENYPTKMRIEFTHSPTYYSARMYEFDWDWYFDEYSSYNYWETGSPKSIGLPVGTGYPLPTQHLAFQYGPSVATALPRDQ